MKAIILSAGQGKRLSPLTDNLPKCLVKIQGKSILEWQLEVLQDGNVDQVVVVTGFKHDAVEELIRKKFPGRGVRTLFNPEYQSADNLFSCWHARSEMEAEFILLNGDTLFEPEVLSTLLSKATGDINLTISSKERYDSDDMKVICQGNKLLRVGKDLPIDRVNAESIGLSLFRGKGPETFKAALKEAVSQPGARKRWYLSVLDRLAQDGMVDVVPVTGLSWCEIDFPRDLRAAERVVATISRTMVLRSGHALAGQVCSGVHTGRG